MTKRRRPARACATAFSPDGSRVREKSRFCLYSASWARALRLGLAADFTAMNESYALFVFFAFAGLRLAATDLLLARTAPFFPAPSSRLARKRDMRSRTPLSCSGPAGSSSLGFLPFILALITRIRLARYSSV